MNEKKFKKLLNVVVILIIIILVVLNFLPRKPKNLNENIAQIQEENVNKKSNIVSTENWDLEKVNIVYDSEGTPVPVPKGFVGSTVTGENTINTGFVIYETENEVNDENAWDMQITKNQFVWIPVYNIDELYGRDENGIARGKLYEFYDWGRSEFCWVENKNKVMSINTNSNYEPMKEDIATSYIPNFVSEEAKAYNKSFEEMIASVIKYGGFYIGRYETGFTTDGANVRKMNTQLGNKNWAEMKSRCKLISSNNNVVTEMIYGCNFDAVIQWLYNTGCKSYAELCKNSGGCGNYTGIIMTYIQSDNSLGTKSGTAKLPTGSSEYTKTNNIYDLAGNVNDWTQEKYGDSYAIVRGGNYIDYSSSYPLSSRYAHYIDRSEEWLGCRSILHIAID